MLRDDDIWDDFVDVLILIYQILEMIFIDDVTQYRADSLHGLKQSPIAVKVNMLKRSLSKY